MKIIIQKLFRKPLITLLTILASGLSPLTFAQSSDDPNVIALLGDSIAAGFNLSLSDVFANGTTTRGVLTTVLRDILNTNSRPSIVTNWGIGGSSSGSGPLGRTNSGISRIRNNLSTTMNTHDDRDYYVLIMYGANNLASQISPATTGFNDGEMIRLARIEGFVPVVSTITPNSEFSVALANASIRAAANNANAPLVDNFTLFDSIPSLFLNDTFFDREVSASGVVFFVHPTDFGYQLVAENWFDSALSNLIEPDSNPSVIAAIISLLLNDESESETDECFSCFLFVRVFLTRSQTRSQYENIISAHRQ